MSVKIILQVIWPRAGHLGAKRRRKAGPSVGERLQAAYESVVRRK
jgi:hypothetical protein